LPLRRRPRIVCLSGYKQSEAFKAAQDDKLLDAVLNKPVTGSMLFETVVALSSGQGGLSLLSNQPGASDDLAGLRVLLVEDNEFNRQLATALLARAGVEVGFACDGVEAVQAVGQQPFDAVLMDIQMPNMDGLEATRNIRKNPALAGLPIIAMTANAMSGDRERCIEAGMNDYVAKPIQVETMYAAIARWTQRSAPSGESGGAGRRMHAAHSGIHPVAHPGLDPDKAMAGMGGEDTYLVVLEKFVRNHDNAVQQIRKALDGGDLKTAGRLAHTLRGIAATVGAAPLAKSVRRLEEAIHKNDAGSYARLVATATEELAQATASASAYLRAAGTVVSGQTQAPPDAAQLGALLEQLIAQLKAFDSDAVDTMRRIGRQVEGSGAAPRFARLERHINDYDYEKALAEAQRLVKETI
jgi:CheY-like chemotaxis protein/HPt (histidine-containing phosphotransfer) domain-containing protein